MNRRPFVTGVGERQLDAPARRAREQSRGDDFLNIAADVGRAELRHRALAGDACEEVSWTVALFRREGRRLDEVAAVGGYQLHSPAPAR